jgi:hypothetical protein
MAIAEAKLQGGPFGLRELGRPRRRRRRAAGGREAARPAAAPAGPGR